MPSKKERVTVTLEDWAAEIVKDLAGPFGAPASVVKQLVEERLFLHPNWDVGNERLPKLLKLWLSLPEKDRLEALRAAVSGVPPKQSMRMIKDSGLEEGSF